MERAKQEALEYIGQRSDLLFDMSDRLWEHPEVGFTEHYAARLFSETLEKEGISCEIIDPRTLVPFDYDTVLKSIAKTGKLMIVHEDNYNGGWGAQLASYVAEHAITSLDAPIVRVAAPDTPTPFSPKLESFVIPSVERITEEARKLAKL